MLSIARRSWLVWGVALTMCVVGCGSSGPCEFDRDCLNGEVCQGATADESGRCACACDESPECDDECICDPECGRESMTNGEPRGEGGGMGDPGGGGSGGGGAMPDACAEVNTCVAGDGCCPGGCSFPGDSDCACQPLASCEMGGYECGTPSDGCGAMLTCYSCGVGWSCGGDFQCREILAGRACMDSDDCPGGWCRAESQLGHVEGDCQVACDAGCEVGTHCVQRIPGMAQSCRPDCETDAECRGAGYACLDVDQDGRTECVSSGHGTGQPGDRCETIADCSGGPTAQCWSVSLSSLSMCTILGCPGATCPAGSHCTAWEESSACYPSCARDADCRAGFSCQDLDGLPPRECWPAP